MGYNILRNNPTARSSDILKPTDKRNFIKNSVLFNLSIDKIRNPGTIVKNKNGIISLKSVRFNIITRSVINNIKIVMRNHSLALNLLIVLTLIILLIRYFFYILWILLGH